MSRIHKNLYLYRQPLSGDWQAVKVAKDGVTITDKYPLNNVQTELYRVMTNDRIIQNVQMDTQNAVKGIKTMDDKHIRETILYIIDSVISQVTGQNEDEYHA